MEIIFFVLFLICMISSIYYLFYENEDFEEKIVKRLSICYFDPFLHLIDSNLKNEERTDDLVDFLLNDECDIIVLENVIDEESRITIHYKLTQKYKYNQVINKELVYSKYPIIKSGNLDDKNNFITVSIQDKEIVIVLLNHRMKIKDIEFEFDSDKQYMFIITNYKDSISRIILDTEALAPEYNFDFDELIPSFMDFDKNNLLKTKDIKQMMLVNRNFLQPSDYNIEVDEIETSTEIEIPRVINQNKDRLIYDNKYRHTINYVSPYHLKRMNILF